jgi:two-component system sensor histidine kinase KdpD
VPRKQIPYKGVTIEEMDTDALIRRNPDVTLVDELAHTNAPGSRHEKRWQDVEDILAAGITVISTVNIQHLESLADIVAAITGVHVRERIPDQVIDEADEVQLVDLSPEALRQRMREGKIYPADRAERALARFFREGNLIALRELALRKMGHLSEDELEQYMEREEIDTVWPAGERVMVSVDEQPLAQSLVRRAWRLANRFSTQLLAVFVETPAWGGATPDQKRSLEANLQFAEDLGAEAVRVRGSDIARSLMQVARERNVGSIVIGHSRHGRLHELLRGSIVLNLLRLASDVDVYVVAERTDRKTR